MVPSHRLRVHRPIRLAMLALALPLLGSCFLLPREDDILAPPLAEPPEIRYETIRPVRADLESTVRAFGTFVFAREVDLAFEKRGGRLDGVYVRVGDRVSEGDLLAALRTADIETDLAYAELALRRARLAYERTAAQLRDEYSLELARADLDLTRLRLDAAETALERERELASITGREMAVIRDHERAVEESRIAVTKAEIAVRRLEGTTGSIELELAAIDVESAELRIRQLERELEAARLYSPLTGLVTWVSAGARESEYIQPFQYFIRIADPSDLVFQYSGIDARHFQAGMECSVQIRDATYRGTVVLTPSSVPFDQREQYRDTIQVAVRGVPADVTPGTSAVAGLVLARREDALVLPRQAVQRYATRRYVHVLVNGVRVERDVEVGLETATEVEIVAGLHEDEEVIVR